LADATAARTLIRQLNEQYDRRGSALRIVELAGGYRLLTRPQLASWLRLLAQTPSEVRLSAPSLETLAVIAYRQPVGRADIEAIRGVNCGEIIRQLMDRDLVKIGGRGDELGRPYLYATTKHFLEIFGLSGLEDLPRAEVVRSAVLPGRTGDAESRVFSTVISDQRSEEEDDVSVTTLAAFAVDEEERRSLAARLAAAPIVAEDDEDDFDDDEDDDFDDDDEDDDDLDDDEDDLDEEDDLEDEEWEEVDDEDDDDLDDDEDDLDDDEDDDDWDDDEEEEDEEWEDDE
jgi:segregation and condensation protein B